jgi:hypothetical protein
MINRTVNLQWIHIVIAVAIFSLTAIIHTFPLITQLSTHIPGYGGDINQYYWAHWWFNQAAERGISEWHTDMQWYPNGTSLVFSTNRFGSAALGHLITPLFGQIAAYNLVILLSYVVSALGVYLLAYYIIKDEVAAYLAAYIFAFNPFKLHALMHHHFLLSTYVFGFALLFLIRIICKKGWHWFSTAGLGLLMAFCFYESIFLTVFMTICLVFVLVILTVFRWRTVLTWKPMVQGTISIIIALLISLPQILQISADISEYGGLPGAPGVVENSNDLYHLIWPSPLLLSTPGQHTQEFFSPKNQTYRTAEENFGMPGWFVIIAAFSGWWFNRKKLWANLSLAGMLMFFMLSLGPFLWVGGQMTNIPLPYQFLQVLPFFSMIRTPSRLVLLGFIFAGLLAAFAFAEFRKRNNIVSRILIIAVPCLIFFDYLPLGINTQAHEDVPDAVKSAKHAQLESNMPAIAHVNTTYIENIRFGAYHEKPMISGYTSRTTLFSRPIQDFSVELLQRLSIYSVQFPDSNKLEGIVARTKRILSAWGIGAVLYKGEPNHWQNLARVLDAELLHEDEEFAFMKLKPVSDKNTGIDFDASTWPKMPYTGLDSGEYADVLWSFERGFIQTIPDSLMQKGRIAVRLSSNLFSPNELKHTVYFYLNRELLGAVEVKNEPQTITLTVPESIKRRPINIFAVRNIVEMDAGSEDVPFSAEIASANTFSGNSASITINRNEFQPYEFLNKTVLMASSPDGKTINLLPQINIHSPTALNQLNENFDSAEKAGYVFLCVSGNLKPKLVDYFETKFSDLGFEIDRDKLRNSSFSMVADLDEKRAFWASSSRSIVNLAINKNDGFRAPLLTVYLIRYR